MTLAKPLRELSVGEIVSQTFSLYFSRFFVFFLPFLVAGLVTGAWGSFVSWVFPMPIAPPMTAPPAVLLSYLVSLVGVVVVTMVLSLLISWVVDTLVGGMAVKVTSDMLEQRPVDLSNALAFTANRLLSLLPAGIITGILIAVGLVCLVVPGIILAIMFSLVVPAIMIERAGALESLSRSRRLVGGRWWKTFGLLLIIALISLVAGAIFGAISALFGPAYWIVSGILGALVSPILPIATTLYYYSMVTRERPTVPPPSPAQPSAKIHCVYCGAENAIDAAFCGKCGKPIVKS